MKSLWALFAVILLSGASFAVNVTTCANITSSGVYTLNTSVSGAPNDASLEIGFPSLYCIKISASNVLLTCNGFSVNGPAGPNTTAGILINGSASSNVTVRDCPNINNYTYGVMVKSPGATLINNTAINNTNYGFLIFLSSGTNLSNNTATRNAYGFLIDSSNSSTLNGNLAYNNSLRGFDLLSSRASNLTNNTAYSNPRGFFVEQSSNSNNLTANTAMNNSIVGISVDSGSGNRLSGNRAFGNAQFGIVLNRTFSAIATGNDAYGNDGGANFYVFQSNGSVLDSNTGNDSLKYGFLINQSSLVQLTGNDAYNNGLDGFFLFSGSGENLSGNIASLNLRDGYSYDGINGSNSSFNGASSNGRHGFHLESSGVGFYGDLANLNIMDGFYIHSSGLITMNLTESRLSGGNGFHFNNSGNYFIDQCLANSSVSNGFLANSSPGGIIQHCTFSYSGMDGAAFYNSPGGIPWNNSIVSNVGNGMSFFTSGGKIPEYNNISMNGGDGYHSVMSGGSIPTLNNISSNVGSGMAMINESGSIPSTNNISFNGGDGITVDGVNGSIYEMNNITGNVGHGMNITRSFGSIFIWNNVSGHAIAGVYVFDSNGTQIIGDRYYGNAPDLLIESAFGNPFTIFLDGVIFDSPSGGLTNYTNVSVNDSVELDSSYLMSWNAQPAPMPGPAVVSFAGKFLNISKAFGSPVVDSIAFNWLDSEIGSSAEANFKLWKYNGTNWSTLNSTPNTAENTLSQFNISSFSTYAILEDIIIPSGGGGGGAGGSTPSLSVSFNQSTGVATVTSGGSPVPGAVVKDNGSDIGTTDGSGQITIPGCNATANLDATKPGYHAASGSFALRSCAPVPACVLDSDCAADQKCESGMCVPLVCPGAIVDHACAQNQTTPVKPECFADSDCPADKYCQLDGDIPGGRCQPVQPGACGQVTGHKFVPFGYECGNESGCPQCPQGRSCISHKCVGQGGELSCPSTGIVGEQKKCTASEDGKPCPSCDYRITDPSGNSFSGKTDGAGGFELPLRSRGTYKVALIRDGSVVKAIEVASLPQSGGEEGGKPSQGGSDAAPLIGLLVLILILAAAFLYWRGRGQKRA
ncbi:MAG: right-handed parallel beta-helix repeat-containing protein [Candidatus Micrarchaeia archaeon]